MFRRLVSLTMSFVIIFMLVLPVFAIESSNTPNDDSSFSFIDTEGKNNTIYVSSSGVGKAHVDHYINGTLTYSVDTVILDDITAISTSLNATSRIQVSVTDEIKGITSRRNEPLSKYIVAENTIINTFNTAEPKATTSYSYQGRINYKSYTDDELIVHNDKLSIYQEAVSTSYEYKTINGVAGDLVSVLISVIASVLAIFLPELSELASNLFYAAVSSVGVSIISGAIQGAIKKQYYVRTTEYNIKARDVSTSRERVYDAERYQVALSGGGYSSNYYYEGYLPWKSSPVAYWMFCDFWSYTYPGVSSYT